MDKKTTVDDIIGIVHTDEPTDSVEEVCKLRGRTNERFKLVDDYLIEYDGDYFDLHKPSDIRSLVTVIKYVTGENEQLKNAIGYHYEEHKRCVDNYVDKIKEVEKENNSLKLLVQNWEALDEEKDEQLDKQNQALKKLKKENEQLRKDATTLVYSNQDYRKENEQLKVDKQALIDFIKKEFPKSHKHILEGLE